ncbi:MAG: MaoC family dehydratase N-terminal domain-containing protein [Syntrophales bacterium]
MADRSKVNYEFPAFTYEVERGKMQELVLAIGDDNAVFLDKESAIEEGYKDTPASPTFSTVPMNWSNMLSRIIDYLKIDFAKVLHGEEGYEYFKEIYPGDVLTGKTRVVSIDEKTSSSGSMEIIKLETMYTNQRNELVLKATALIVERK